MAKPTAHEDNTPHPTHVDTHKHIMGAHTSTWELTQAHHWNTNKHMGTHTSTWEHTQAHRNTHKHMWTHTCTCEHTPAHRDTHLHMVKPHFLSCVWMPFNCSLTVHHAQPIILVPGEINPIFTTFFFDDLFLISFKNIFPSFQHCWICKEGLLAMVVPIVSDLH